MNARNPPRAVVVGAGIGGLASALALERAGCSVVVLERAPELRELGFALLLAANAMHALRLLGVADRVRSRAEVAKSGELRAISGRVLKRVSLDSIRAATRDDSVCALRQALHETLLGALEKTRIRTGARVASVESSTRGVTATLEEGEVVEGDFLVAADGLYSIVRRRLVGDGLRSSGLFAYRGVTRGPTWGDSSGAQYFGRGIEAGVARAGGDSVYWYLSTKHRPHNGTPPKQAVLGAVRGFDPALVALIERTEPADLRFDELCDRKPLASWRRQRVTLLGDAAHPMLPHAGQGAAQALEDAVVLGRCLSGTSDIDAALDRYERLRIPRTTRVVAIARRNARVGSLDGRVSCALRDLLLQYGPAVMMEKQIVALARVQLEV